MNNLAEGLSDQGKYEQAKEMHRQASGLKGTVPGKEHPLTLTSMDNLSLVSATSQEDERHVIRTARPALDECTAESINVSSERRGVSIGPNPAIGERGVPSAASLWFPLRPQEFRLLHRNGKGELQLQLKTHKIEFPPRYQALSYACGTEPKDRRVLCSNWDGTSHASLYITQTLYDALNELAVEEIPIWVDAICINQTNPEEKSEQVALMHRIYRRADQVAIWLDRRRGDNTGLALDILSWISMPPTMSSAEKRLELLPALKRHLERPGNSLQIEQLQKLASVVSKSQHIRISQMEFQRMGIPYFHEPLWKALGDVFSPPWLFRLWTFQELMLGTDCFVAFGNSKLPWRTYFDVGMQLSLCGLLDHCITHLPSDRKAHALTAFTRLEPFLNSSQKVIPFWRCLDEARQREVTETVDRIYAVLSLANEKLRSQITINYSGDWKANYWDLFLEVGKAVMETSTSQALLAGANSKTKAKQLPSWCPDFTVPCEVVPFGVNGRAGMRYGRSIPPHYDKKVINIGGAKIDIVDRMVRFSWSWPRQDISDIYGPDGLAAQTLRWLNTCWSSTREAYAHDEAGAHRAFVLTILGEIPDAPDAFSDDVWFKEKNDTLVDVRKRLENLKICTGPEDTDDSSEAWHRFLIIFQKLDDIWRNRVFFSTKKGRIGFASDRISPGDHVCVFFGESHLYVLRDRSAGFYKFVSDAYVDGYITGHGCDNLLDNMVFKLN
jgi:hypothetical protein